MSGGKMNKLFLAILAFLSVLFSFQASAAPYSVRNAYASTNVTTSAWVQLLAKDTLSFQTSAVCIFDSSGQTLKLGLGASGQEQQVLIIPPGGGCFPLAIPPNDRLSIKAITATASSGEIDLNFFQ